MAEDLRVEYPKEFALLASHRIPIYYSHDDSDWRAHQHVIELDANDEVSGVKISQPMADGFDLPQEVLDEYYPAFCLYLRKVHDPRYVNRFRMNAGECFVFDNHRIDLSASPIPRQAANATCMGATVIVMICRQVTELWSGTVR